MGQSSSRPRAVLLALLVGLLAPLVGPVAPTDAITTSGGCGVTVVPTDEVLQPVLDRGIERLAAAGDHVRALTYDGDVLALRPDGSVDRDFGSGGVASTLPDIGEVIGFPDGSILLVAVAYDGPRRLELMRLGADGTPDTRLGPGGRTTVLLDGTADGSAYGVEAAPLEAGGWLLTTRSGDVGAILRLDELGRPDESFGTDGVTTFELEEGSSETRVPRNAVELPDGDLLVIGSRVEQGAGFTSYASLSWRFSPDGVQDDEHGLAGIELIDGFLGFDLLTRTDASHVLSIGQIFSGSWGIAVLDLDTQTVEYVHGEGHRLVAAGRAGDLVVTAEPTEGGLAGELPATVAHRRLDGTLDTDLSGDGQVEVSITDQGFEQLRLAPVVHDDGSVTFVGVGEAWEFGAQVLLVRHLTAQGTTPQGHGWCPDTNAPGTTRVARIAGDDRFATAVALSREGYPDGTDTVVLATGTNFPDALAGGPAAAAWRAPVLLVRPDELGTSVAEELRRLDPDRIVVLGGVAAVSDRVITQAREATGVAPERIAGANRYETAVAIARAAFPTATHAFVTTGANFPDALAAGAVAGSLDAPVLLTTPTGLPDVTRRAIEDLAPEEVVIVGGDSAVGPTPDQLFDGPWYTEVVIGLDRFETARRLNERFRAEQDGHVGRPLATMFLATGRTFPDALAGSALAGVAGGVISLVPADRFDERVRDLIGQAHPRTIYVLGGRRAVDDVWVDTLRRPGATSFTYLGEPYLGEGPVRWNPCEPVRWVFDPSNAPDGGLEMMQEGLRRITAASGWEFTYEGTTDEPAELGRPVHQPDRYGDRWAPVVMGWGETSAGAAGQAGPTWVNDVNVSGVLVLSRHLTLPMTYDDDGWGPIFMHEVGHVLGLDHPGDERELMWWITREGVDDLGEGDVAGLRQLRQGGCLEVPPPFSTSFVRSAVRD